MGGPVRRETRALASPAVSRPRLVEQPQLCRCVSGAEIPGFLVEPACAGRVAREALHALLGKPARIVGRAEQQGRLAIGGLEGALEEEAGAGDVAGLDQRACPADHAAGDG